MRVTTSSQRSGAGWSRVPPLGVALVLLAAVPSIAWAGSGSLELHFACEGQGFAGEYTIEGTTILFESCETPDGTVATVENSAGEKVYRATATESEGPSIALWGSDLSSDGHSEKAVELVKRFIDSPEAAAMACLQRAVRAAGLTTMSEHPPGWTSLFAMNQAFEGIAPSQLPCANAAPE